MTHSLHTVGDGTVVHHWRQGLPRAAVVLQHGFAEYAERYVEEHARLVPRLLDAGYEVWAPDLWGHGRSPGRRAVTSVRLAVRDHLLTRELAARGGRPVVLLGHSLGGLVTAASVVNDASAVSGVVLLAPALQRPEPAVVRRLLGAAATAAPWVPIPRRARPLSELSRDPRVGERAAADPVMHHGQVTVLLAATALDEAARLWPALPQWQAPTLVVHGTADTYTDPEASRDFVGQIAGEDKALHLVDGGYHELLDDYAAEEVLDLVTDWLLVRTAARDRR